MPRHRFFYGRYPGAMTDVPGYLPYLATLPATLSTSQVREKGGA